MSQSSILFCILPNYTTGVISAVIQSLQVVGQHWARSETSKHYLQWGTRICSNMLFRTLDRSRTAQLGTENFRRRANLSNCLKHVTFDAAYVNKVFIMWHSQRVAVSGESVNDNGKEYKYVCITTNQPDTKSNPNPTATTGQPALVSIQLNIVTCPSYTEKFIRDKWHCSIFTTFCCQCNSARYDNMIFRHLFTASLTVHRNTQQFRY